MAAKDTVLSDMDCGVLLTNLSYRAQAGEDIRWDKVSEIIAREQAEITWRVCKKEEVEWLKSHLLEVDYDSRHPKQAFLDFRITQKEWQALLKSEEGIE